MSSEQNYILDELSGGCVLAFSLLLAFDQHAMPDAETQGTRAFQLSDLGLPARYGAIPSPSRT